MKGGKLPLGYTIVEVMIVLAVSGVMFIIAANFVSGKQARTAFTQGVNDLTSELQSTIESVTDGQYTDYPITCLIMPGPPRSLKFLHLGTSKQGTNYNCTFIGQLLHFDLAGNKSSYEKMYLAAAKEATIGGPLTLRSDSALTAITLQHGTVNLNRTQSVPQGLDVDGMDVTTSTGVVNGVYNIGIVQGLGSASVSQPGVYASGAQTLSLVADLSIDSNKDSAYAGNSISQSIASAQSVVICLTDGTRFAHITIGDNGNQLKATAKLGDAARVCS